VATIEQTVDFIVAASTWDERVARVRQIPQRHGTDEHAAIDAEVARLLYVPHLAPDFAYVQILDFYELPPSKLLMTSSSLPRSARTVRGRARRLAAETAGGVTPQRPAWRDASGGAAVDQPDGCGDEQC
jgi:hypothetical protein